MALVKDQTLDDLEIFGRRWICDDPADDRHGIIFAMLNDDQRPTKDRAKACYVVAYVANTHTVEIWPVATIQGWAMTGSVN